MITRRGAARPALVALTAATALGALGAAPAAAAAPGPAPAPERPYGERPLPALASLSAERVELADKVAAAKWGTGKAIDDPERERVLLRDVAEKAARTGVAPEEATAVFRDQIEANKAVQRGLFARWDRHPAERPRERPDLARDVRPALDRIMDRLLTELRRSDAVRHSPSCPFRLAGATGRAAEEHRLDALHGAGLARAVRSVC